MAVKPLTFITGTVLVVFTLLLLLVCTAGLLLALSWSPESFWGHALQVFFTEIASAFWLLVVLVIIGTMYRPPWMFRLVARASQRAILMVVVSVLLFAGAVAFGIASVLSAA